jgi:hypothetical protein
MDPDQGRSDRPLGSSTTSTTTTHGPYSTTTTHSTSAGQGTQVTHFGPQSTTITHPAVTATTRMPVPQAPAPSANPSRLNPQRVHSSSIRIRRPTSQILPAVQPPQPLQSPNDDTWQAGRRRSSSEPRPPSSVLFPEDNDLRRQITATPLQPVYEDGARTGDLGSLTPGAAPPSRGPSTRRQGMNRQISALNIRRNNHHKQQQNQNQNQNQNNMDANVVDVLDVIGQFVHAVI